MSAPGSLTVRPVRREDVPQIWTMLSGLAEYEKLTDILTGTPAMLEEALFGDGPRVEARVADTGDALVGYALFYPILGSVRQRWRMWLEDLWVEPSARGLGVGERLLAEVSRLAEDRGFRSVDWEVIEWNDPALEFYRHLGGHDLGGGWLRYRLEGEALGKLARTARV
jgi:ribosomal protein S18 acetylase RimI-like enzyme